MTTRRSITWVNDDSNSNDRRMYVDGQHWAKVYGWDHASLNARCDILAAALSAAPLEGQGEQGLSSSAEVADTHRDPERPVIDLDAPELVQNAQCLAMAIREVPRWDENHHLITAHAHAIVLCQDLPEALAHQAPVSPAEQVETDWIEWAGGENPVPGQRVNLRQIAYRNDDAAVWESDAQDWKRSKQGEAGDIVAYRVVSPADRGIG